MSQEHLDCPSAFRKLKKAHRPAFPNEGFQAQLKLYGKMGGRIDPDNPEYRLFRLEHLVDERACKIGKFQEASYVSLTV
jgi:hypothetical protein